MKFLAGFISFLLLAASAAPALADRPEGLWLARDGRGKVVVAPCEHEQQVLCGKIVWVRPGEPEVDGNNNRIMGMLVAWNMAKTGDNEWTGRVYDPERGRSYEGYMSLLESGKLKVTGCLTSFLCQSKYWEPLDE